MRTESLVILWCGADVHLRGEGRDLARRLEESDEPAAAIAGLVAEEFPAARAVRIAYHPDSLGEGAVPSLTQAIADSGCEVDGAWPLLALLEPALAAAGRARPRSGRRRTFARPSRRTLGRSLALLLGLGALAAVGLVRHRHALARRQAEQEREAGALGRASTAATLAAQGRLERLRRALRQIQVPAQFDAALLAELARATPAAISLRELRCEGGGFLLRGHVHEGAGRPDSPLPAYRRELEAPGAPWRLSDEPGSGAADFAWRGIFRTETAEPTLAEAEALLPVERGRLPTAPAFEAGLAEWGGRWAVVARSAERTPDLETRHYALAYVRPTLGAWSDIVATIGRLCAQPGVSVDNLVLAAAPDGSDAFAQAQVTLTARLRP